ncbi:MAG: NUDIX hydrolase [Allorhizobium sp.]
MPAKPLAASSAIVESDGRFLLVKRRNPPAADLYAFPGGRGEAGETPEDTALRELLEETGIEGFNPRLFAVYDLKSDRAIDGPPSHFLLSVFLVETAPAPQAVADSDASEVGWFSLAEIALLPAPPSVLECAERLARERQAR